MLLVCQIATYKVRTVRVVDERSVTDSANDGSGHVDRPPTIPKLDSPGVRALIHNIILMSRASVLGITAMSVSASSHPVHSRQLLCSTNWRSVK